MWVKVLHLSRNKTHKKRKVSQNKCMKYNFSIIGIAVKILNFVFVLKDMTAQVLGINIPLLFSFIQNKTSYCCWIVKSELTESG